MEVTVKDSNVDYRYEIIPANGKFDIKYAGSVVCTIKKNSSWQQVSGTALSPDAFRQLVLYIEAYYD